MKKFRLKDGLLTALALLALTSGAFAAPQAPAHLQIPAIAAGEDALTLVWQKPAEYQDVAGYHIYMNGQFIGDASQDAASAAKAEIAAFHSANPSAQNTSKHMFYAANLKPDTKYVFTVRAIDKKGAESADSNSVSAATRSKAVKSHSIAEYGAIGDGDTLNTRAIQKAVDACAAGGTVVIPSGVFKTGAIWLKSDMTLELQKDAVLLGSENAEDYPYHYKLYPYLKDERYYGLINARPGADGEHLHNIRIVGEGVIDGNGWKMNEAGTEYLYTKNTVEKDGTPGKNHVLNIGILAANEVRALDQVYKLNTKQAYPRRSSLILMQGVDHLYYHGITVRNPANHTIVNQHCNDVVIENVNFRTYNCNNGDGIEFAHGSGLLVANNVFDTGDDCVNFAAGQGKLGAKDGATENIWIFNNSFHHGHGAVVMGSHTAAFIQNVLAEDNVIDGTDVGLRMKTAPINGGGARDVVFRDNAMKNLQSQAFIFTTAYNDPNAIAEFPKADQPGSFYNVHVSNCTVDGAKGPGIEIQGLENARHHDISFSNIKFLDTKPWKISYMKNASFDNVVVTTTAEEQKAAEKKAAEKKAAAKNK